MADDGDASGPDQEAAPPEPETLHGCPVTWSAGQQVLHVARDRYSEVMGALRDDGFDLCSDLCGVDYLSHPSRTDPAGRATPGSDGLLASGGDRFEVVVNLTSRAQRRRLRVRVPVPEDDPTLPSLFSLWPGTEAMEREAWDMFGVVFRGHPDLTRILMPEDWEGHPLRKDYAVGRVAVQFKGPDQARPDGVRQ